MTEARAQEGAEQSSQENTRNLQREAFMRTAIRAALKEFDGNIAVVCGAWHISGLRQPRKPADDRALIIDLPRVKIEATWVPRTDKSAQRLLRIRGGCDFTRLVWHSAIASEPGSIRPAHPLRPSKN